jgi:tetratricopeptide (TPR) repeat protein
MVMEIVVTYAEGGDVAESQRLLDEALAYIKGTDARRSRGELLAWGSRLATYRGDLAQAGYYRDEAIATLGGSTADRGRAALTNCGFDLDVGDIAAAVAHGQDALALVREVGLPLRIAECCLGLGEALLAAGESAAARDTLVEGLGISQRRGRRGLIPELAARAARACARLGDIAAARAYAETAHTTAQPTDAEARSIAGVALGEVSEAEGDLAAAELSFRAALTILEPTGLLNARAFTREAYAEFLLRHGRAADARTELEAARKFHRDPMAFRHRERIDALLARTQVSA